MNFNNKGISAMIGKPEVIGLIPETLEPLETISLAARMKERWSKKSLIPGITPSASRPAKTARHRARNQAPREPSFERMLADAIR
jgi:hypothetical protein